jgi:hypothetical protein
MPPWPSVLLEEGYRIAGIDHRILLPPASLIKPDVITLSRKSNCALLWECKSGGNVDVYQLDRYRKFLDYATAKDIQRVTSIQFPDPDAAYFQVAYCFLEEAVPRILKFFEPEPRMPVVSLGHTTRSVSGDLHDAALNQVFRAGFTTPSVEQVPWIIVADAQTTDGEFALYLLPTVVSLIVKQTERVSVIDLLAQTFLDWQCISPETRAALKDKAARVLKDVCGGEFKEHARFCKPGERLHEPSLEVVSELMTQDPSTQTRGLQKLKEQVKDAAKRLEEGRPYVPPPPAAEQRSFPFEPSG